MNADTKSIRKKNIYRAIQEFADVDHQDRVWYAKSASEMSSFIEAKCILFDDLDIEMFVSEWEENGISRDARDLLFHFIELLKAVDRQVPPYPRKEDLSKVREWPKVVETARSLMNGDRKVE